MTLSMSLRVTPRLLTAINRQAVDMSAGNPGVDQVLAAAINSAFHRF
jgi:hypothetical protein